MAPPTDSQGLLEVSACGLLSCDLSEDTCPSLLLLFGCCIVELLAERLKLFLS